MRNDELQKEINVYTDESKQVLDMNQTLLNENKRLRRDIALQKQENEELLRQNYAQTQVIKALSSKFASMIF